MKSRFYLGFMLLSLCHGCSSHGTTDSANLVGDRSSLSGSERKGYGAGEGEYATRWYFRGSDQGWTMAHSVSGGVSDEVLEVDVRGPDPYIVSPDSLGIDANAFSMVRVSMQNMTRARHGQLYFLTADGTWCEQGFELKAEDASFSEYVIDLRSTYGWSGRIDQIRLDLGEGENGRFRIRDVGVGRNFKEVRAGWQYIDSGHLRVGIDGNRGAAIGHISEAAGENYIDHFDEGRYLQQSYYGDFRGGSWQGRPWPFNPVQGGDAQRNPSRSEITVGDGRIYAQTFPKDWGGSGQETPGLMEELITLQDGLVRMQFRYQYFGNETFSARPQEVPALFVNRKYDNLTFVKDGYVQQRKPRILGPNLVPEDVSFDEGWLAYVNDSGRGIGLYTRNARTGVSYLVGSASEAGRGATSYFALTTTFGIRPGFVYEYVVYAKIGTVDEIREAFQGLRDQGL